MKKCLLLVLIYFASVNFVYAEYVSAKLLNVRSEPNTNSKVLTQLTTNSKVEIVKTQNDWIYIKWMDKNSVLKNGWVFSKYISDKPVLIIDGANKEFIKALTATSKKQIKANRNYRASHYPVSYSKDRFEIVGRKFRCNDNLIVGGLSDCTLDVEVYYGGSTTDYSGSHWADCSAVLDYLVIDDMGYKMVHTAKMRGGDVVYKNTVYGNVIRLRYNFSPIMHTVKAAVRNISCELVY